MKNNNSRDFSFDLFWSFRSPFCYLGLDRILEIKNKFDDSNGNTKGGATDGYYRKSPDHYHQRV